MPLIHTPASTISIARTGMNSDRVYEGARLHEIDGKCMPVGRGCLFGCHFLHVDTTPFPVEHHMPGFEGKESVVPAALHVEAGKETGSALPHEN